SFPLIPHPRPRPSPVEIIDLTVEVDSPACETPANPRGVPTSTKSPQLNVETRSTGDLGSVDVVAGDVDLSGMAPWPQPDGEALLEECRAIERRKKSLARKRKLSESLSEGLPLLPALPTGPAYLARLDPEFDEANLFGSWAHQAKR
ncbi:6213_t:CDS:2, partial [Acaulospora colombiana]